MWAVLNITDPFWILSILRHLILGETKWDRCFGNYPSVSSGLDLGILAVFLWQGLALGVYGVGVRT